MKLTSRVLLADDHAIVREGLRRILEPDFEIVGEVADGSALVTAVDALRPDIVIADISMPLLNGIDAARQIRKITRKSKVIFLTMHSEVAYAAAALSAGGSAYVLKSSMGAEILEAIGEVLQGRNYVTPSIDRQEVMAQMGRAGRRDDVTSEPTPREREVLQLLAEGKASRKSLPR